MVLMITPDILIAMTEILLLGKLPLSQSGTKSPSWTQKCVTLAMGDIPLGDMWQVLIFTVGRAGSGIKKSKKFSLQT